MRLRGGKTDSDTGNHVLGTPFDLKETFTNDNTIYSKSGALTSKDESQILATSRQVYDYLTKNSTEKNNVETYELSVSRHRQEKNLYSGERNKHVNAENEVHLDVLTPIDDKNPEAYLLYKYNMTKGIFVLVDGELVASNSDSKTFEFTKIKQKTLDLYYLDLTLFEEAEYYKLVKENEQQILDDLLNPKPTSSFTYLAAAAGGGAAGAAAGAGAAGAGAAAAGAGAVGLLAAPAAAGAGAGAVAVVGAGGAGAGALVAGPAVAAGVAGVALGLFGTVLGAIGLGAVVGAGANSFYQYWTNLTSGQKLQVIKEQIINVREAEKNYNAAVYLSVKASKEFIQFEKDNNNTDQEYIKELEGNVLKQVQYFRAQEQLDKEKNRIEDQALLRLNKDAALEEAKRAAGRAAAQVAAGRAAAQVASSQAAAGRAAAQAAAQVASSQAAQVPTLATAAANAAAQAAAGRAAAQVASSQVAAQAASSQDAAGRAAAQAAANRTSYQAAAQVASSQAAQVPTLATAAANAAMGQRLNLLQRPDYENRYLERVMMRRRTPSDRSHRQIIRRRTPSPRRRTPSPRRRTPSPRRRTPSPRSRTPSPRRKVTRKRKTPSLKLKRKLAAKRR